MKSSHRSRHRSLPAMQRKALNLIVSGKARNAKEALRAVGYSENYAGTLGKQHFPLFHQALLDAYARAGITEDGTAMLIKEAYGAVKQERTSDDKYSVVPDHYARLKAADTYLKSTGRLYPAQQEQQKVAVGVFVVPTVVKSEREWDRMVKEDTRQTAIEENERKDTNNSEPTKD